ncbi:MAG: hypothetical protein IJC10_00150 [Clostridia bacterium]|nr:hypothetical protein [Clostridia bacterium]
MKTMITLYAEEGMILTDGETFGTTMQLAEDRTADGIKEISLEEYDKILEAEAKEALDKLN